ncbi:hypothetical protein C6980_21390 [Escherichia coli]|nr:hypothetical protein C6980_21390 [Escherichia coli]
MLVPDVAYPARKFNRLRFYRWPDKHGVSGITDLFFRPIINILRHSRRFFKCAYKALLPAAP